MDVSSVCKMEREQFIFIRFSAIFFQVRSAVIVVFHCDFEPLIFSIKSARFLINGNLRMHACSWSSAKHYLKKAIVSLLLLFFTDHQDQIVCGLQSNQRFTKDSLLEQHAQKQKENLICKQQILKAGILLKFCLFTKIDEKLSCENESGC